MIYYILMWLVIILTPMIIFVSVQRYINIQKHKSDLRKFTNEQLADYVATYRLHKNTRQSDNQIMYELTTDQEKLISKWIRMGFAFKHISTLKRIVDEERYTLGEKNLLTRLRKEYIDSHEKWEDR